MAETMSNVSLVVYKKIVDGDLRKFSATETVKLDFDGYSIGGVANDGESKEDMYKAIDYSIPYLPKDKVRYLMGVGEPLDIIEGVEELVRAKAYMIILRNREGIQVVGFKTLPENWKMRQSKG